uniref:PDEase domain-containing protein n=1 Tax=Macrostomum lignano TaxID=282301 RepID=A0A1I8F6E7_9PLAT
ELDEVSIHGPALHPGEETQYPSGRALLLMNKPDGKLVHPGESTGWRRPSPCSAVCSAFTTLACTRKPRVPWKTPNGVALPKLDDAIRRLSKLPGAVGSVLEAQRLRLHLISASGRWLLSSSTELRALNRLDKMALLIACLCHDLDHRGTDNKFQKLTLSPLASAVQLVNAGAAPLQPPQYECCIETIEKCILATDLERHFQEADPSIIDTGSFDISCPETRRTYCTALLMTAADPQLQSPSLGMFSTRRPLGCQMSLRAGDRERSELNMQREDLKDRDKRCVSLRCKLAHRFRLPASLHDPPLKEFEDEK